MANIYDVAAAIKQPDIVGNFNQGVQTAQQNQVFGEKQRAYQQAQADQQNIRALAPQIIAGDPAAADQAAAIDPDAAAKYQGVADQHIKRLSGAISYIDSQKDPQAKEAAYQQVRPFLAQFGQQPPATFAEAEPKMEAARAQIAMLGQPKSDLINVGAGGAVFDPKTRQAVYTNPGVQKTPGIVSVNLPDGSTQQYQQNPDGSLAPLRLAGQGAAQPQGPMQTTITPASPANTGAADQANALLAQGKSPQEVMQALIQAHPDQKFQLAVDPQTGQFKDVSDGSAQFKDAAPEVAGLGHSAPKSRDAEGNTPSGYRYNADRTALEPIPGGPADRASQGVTGNLSDDAIQNAAWRDILTGDSGIRGYNKEAVAQRAQISNLKAKIAKEAGVSPAELATRSGQQKALQGSLNNLQKQSDVMQKSEIGFQNNLDQALQLSEKLDRTGSPVVNKWLLGGRAALGDPDVAAFDAAINAASVDYARIMSGQTGAGGTPISTAEEAKQLLRKELSNSSLQAVAEVLHRDLQGQQDAVKQQRQTITDAMNAFGPSATASSGTGAPKAGMVEGGYRFKGGDPANQGNWEKL